MNEETDWHPTACNLCYANCGVLVQVDRESGDILKVRGDKQHPASKGYVCNKAARINFYQKGKDRLDSPLKRTPDGDFEQIGWDQAIAEIASRLSEIKINHGGDKIFYYGGGGQGNHVGGSYSQPLRRFLGMKYQSNALAQEKTGLAWMNARMIGGGWHGDFENCDVGIIIGKNPWQSNSLQRARVLMKELSKNPDRTLIVFDPRRTETAQMADIHLAVKPGTDVWCLAAILGFLVQNDKVDLDWIERRTVGYERILRQLKKVPIQDYAAFAGISMEQIESAAECISSTNKVAVYEDLGVEMSPYSTLCSYLNILLFVLPGAYDTEGGTHIPQGLGNILAGDLAHEDDDGYEFDRARSPVTGARLIQGLTPCNSIPEEILSDHPDRFRGMIVESANPVHSLADTKRFLEAFEALELVVVIDVAMTETARVADYVLPASSQYEKSEGTFFPAEFPENFFHLRAPVLDPLPGTLSEAEIYARLLEELDGAPTVAYEELKVAAEAGLGEFSQKIGEAMSSNPEVAGSLPYLLYRTLGPSLPYANAEAASIWGLCQSFVMRHADQVRAAGFEGEGPELGNALFRGLLDNPSGSVISKTELGHPSQWPKERGKIQLRVSEMNDELDSLSHYKMPERSREFPLLLCAGERRSYTANTIIRDPKWMKSNNPSCLSVNPVDARRFGLKEAGRAILVSKRGRAEILVELDDRIQEGSVSLPNGLGLVYPNEKEKLERFGVHLNELTDLEDRDPWVGTPYHKHVRVRLEKIETSG